MWIKSLLSILSVILNYLEKNEYVKAGEIKQINKIRGKILDRVKIKLRNKLDVDNLSDDLLLPPDERDSDK